MTCYIDQVHVSGNKLYGHLYADTERELYRMAERLREEVKDSEGDYIPHLDLNEHKMELALRYGAVEIEE